MSQSDPSAPERYCPTCDRSFAQELEQCPDDGTRLVVLSEQDTLLNRDLDGRFTLKERIGAGGMGTVYLAWQHSVGREVAVKIIQPHGPDPRAAAKRFLREASLASRLSQPNVVSVIDFGQTKDGILYLAMELLKGRTLREVLKSEGPLSVGRAIRIGLQLCDALRGAHQLSIIHRDLKSSNVVVLDDPPGRDFVKVLDFGLAKSLDQEGTNITSTGVVVGTPTYLAPETAAAGPIDERSDLYSLGVVLYEMVAGRVPFHAPDTKTLLASHLYQPPPPLPAVAPPVLSNVIVKLLQKDPDHRYQSAEQVHHALEAARETMPSEVLRVRADPPAPLVSEALASTEAPATRVAKPNAQPKRPRRGRITLAFAGAGLLAAGLAFFVALNASRTRTHPPPPAAAPKPVPSGAERPAAAPTVASPPPPRAAAPPPAPEPAPVDLTLRSIPSSTVSVDGHPAGRTPTVIHLPAGSSPVEVVFTRPGHEPVRKRVVPDRSQVVEARFAERKKKAEPAEEFLAPP